MFLEANLGIVTQKLSAKSNHHFPSIESFSNLLYSPFEEIIFCFLEVCQ